MTQTYRFLSTLFLGLLALIALFSLTARAQTTPSLDRVACLPGAQRSRDFVFAGVATTICTMSTPSCSMSSGLNAKRVGFWPSLPGVDPRADATIIAMSSGESWKAQQQFGHLISWLMPGIPAGRSLWQTGEPYRRPPTREHSASGSSRGPHTEPFPGLLGH